MPLSLRLSGVLLLGAVNVYVIKLDMLQKDSHRALETLEQVPLPASVCRAQTQQTIDTAFHTACLLRTPYLQSCTALVRRTFA